MNQPKHDSTDFEFTTGRELRAYGGIVGIDVDLSVYGGYDDKILDAADSSHDPWTPAERAELADHMIDLWTRFKGGATGWLPIETAPRDETPIIVGFDCASVWIVRKAWWRDGAALQSIGLDFTAADTGWWSYTRGSVTQEQLDGWRAPTHWIPMPDLPK